ncbi:MAG: hypothetical protein AB7V45_16990 [Candidatus Krumholzibacteriia bacterium]
MPYRPHRLALCALLLMPCVALATGQVGEPAPDFSLMNTAGETVDVVFGHGEVFLLAFVGYG